MTIDEARHHYAVVLTALKAERWKRDTFLREPRRSQAMHEMAVAIEALEQLGAVVKLAADAGLLESGHEQAALLDVPPGKPYL